jgi:hypothetical protein
VGLRIPFFSFLSLAMGGGFRFVFKHCIAFLSVIFYLIFFILFLNEGFRAISAFFFRFYHFFHFIQTAQGKRGKGKNKKNNHKNSVG